MGQQKHETHKNTQENKAAAHFALCLRGGIGCDLPLMDTHRPSPLRGISTIHVARAHVCLCVCMCVSFMSQVSPRLSCGQTITSGVCVTSNTETFMPQWQLYSSIKRLCTCMNVCVCVLDGN